MQGITKGERTRVRIIEAAAQLIEEQGTVATGITAILEASESPRGSLYFHFPGGKEEIVCAAIALAAERWRGLLQAQMAPATTAGEAVTLACRGLGGRLKASGFQLGCPMATTTLELGTDDGAVREVCEQHFASWERYLAERFTALGVPVDAAPRWARHVLAAVEGALILCRAQKSTAPLRDTGELLAALLDAEVARAARAPAASSAG